MWEEILNRALLGTEKQPFTVPPPGEGAVSQLLSRLDASDGEGALLRTAGVLAVYRRAGTVAAEDSGPLPPAAEEETLPLPGQEAQRLLERMLSGDQREFLPLWLRRAAETGRRAPETSLVDLLQQGQQSVELRKLIRPVLGKRGLWMAELNPDWRYLAGDVENDRTWEEGTLGARSAYLRRLRGLDAAKARELLEEVWKNEPAKERTEFLAQFETGLSMEDEPFLEQALDDRSKEVKSTAAGLLARLAESRLVGRMTERLKSLVQVEKKMLRGAKLAVGVPENVDAAMKRDGIQEKGSAPFGLGEKAFRLYQIVRAVPPRWWQEELEATPTELIRMAEKSDWQTALLAGWREAAMVHRDAEWAGALLDHGKGDVLKHYYQRSGLWEALPPEERRKRFLEEARRGKITDREALLELPEPWDPEFSRAVLEALVPPMLKKTTGWNYTWTSTLSALAQKLAPEVLPDAERLAAGVPDKTTAPGMAMESFLDDYRFRCAILKELAP